MRKSFLFVLASLFSFFPGATWCPAQDKEAPVADANATKPQQEAPKFLRIARDPDKKPVALETVVTSYKFVDPQKADVQVDLVGAVHVGEKAYYDALNSLFESYDALLYELVAPENTKVPKERPAGATSAVGTMQVVLKDVLHLEFQLDCVDYHKPNFVHADMSPKEFAASMEKRGESFMKMYLRAVGFGMTRQSGVPSGNSDLQMLMGMFTKNRPYYLKLAMAQQFDDMEGQIQAIEGPEGSTILSQRNVKALQVLDRELQAGKKKIGIFYGAAHLPDMEKRLITERNMQRTGEKWLEAWDLRKPSK